MTLARGEREWALLVSEYNICKKKLESKRQALRILMEDLESCQRERDIYKTKIKQLQHEVDNYKKQEREQESKELRGVQSPVSSRSPEHIKMTKRGRRLSGNSIWEQELQNVRDRKNKTLSQLLCESREENKALRNDFKDLRVLYREAQEDILLLRENLARQRGNNKGQGTVEDLQARQDLIRQLEDSHEKIDALNTAHYQVQELERDVQAAKDETNEISIERDHYREKAGRLNTQLNFILGADDRRLVDIDAVLMDNRYQKEQIKQLKEEKIMASAALTRYKAAFEKKKTRLLKAGYGKPGTYIGTKQVFPSMLAELSSTFGGGVSSSTVNELQFLANSLSESLSEKDIALLHMKNTNRILGTRVAELEKKLKTLEVSGLWSLEGHRGYGSEEMGKLRLRRSPRSSDAESETSQSANQTGESGESPPESSPRENGDAVFLFNEHSGEKMEESCLVDVNSTGSPTISEEEEEEYEVGETGDSPDCLEGDSLTVSDGDSLCRENVTLETVDSIEKPNIVNNNGDRNCAVNDGKCQGDSPVRVRDPEGGTPYQGVPDFSKTVDTRNNGVHGDETLSTLGDVRESPLTDNRIDSIGDVPDIVSNQMIADSSEVENEMIAKLCRGDSEASDEYAEFTGFVDANVLHGRLSVLLSPVETTNEETPDPSLEAEPL